MKRSLVVVLSMLIGLFITPCVYGQAKTSVSIGEFSRVLAAVDGEPITTADLKQYAESVGEPFAGSVDADKEKRAKLLKEFIAAKLLDKEASSLHITVSDDDIDNYIAEVRRQNNLTEKDFVALLKTKGIELNSYREQVRRDVLKSRIVSAVIRSSINISDEDIDRYLEAHVEEKPKEGQVHVEQVKVSIDSSTSREDALSELESLRSQVVAGKQLKGLADSKYTDLGYVNPDDLREEFKAAVSSLNPGDVSDIVETSQALYLFRIATSGGESHPGDASVRDSIRRDLFEKKMKERMDRYVQEDLPKKYSVEINQ